MKKGNADSYFACLVRFWREGENSSWRVTVEDPHTNKKQNFANPEECWCFLQTILTNSEIDHINYERNIDD